MYYSIMTVATTVVEKGRPCILKTVSVDDIL
jgi:hypothetical protein